MINSHNRTITNTSDNNLSSSIHSQNGAQVHGVHIISRPSQDHVHNDPIRLLRGMVLVPERVLVPVRAQVRQNSAEPDPIVWSLATTSNLWCHKPIGLWIGDVVHTGLEGIGSNKHIWASLAVELVDDLNQLRVEEICSSHELWVAVSGPAPLGQFGWHATEWPCPCDQNSTGT